MKKHLLVSVSMLVTLYSSAQVTNDSILMTVSYPANTEVRNFLEFEQIDYYDIFFTGEQVNGRTFKIIANEFWEGKLSNENILIDTKTNGIGPLNSDTLRMTVIGKKFTENLLKIQFKLPWAGSTTTHKATSSNSYSLRAIGKDFRIEPGKKFYAFAYILPYQDGNFQKYCTVAYSGKDVESWGKEFGIEHYVVYEMIFE